VRSVSRTPSDQTVFLSLLHSGELAGLLSRKFLHFVSAFTAKASIPAARWLNHICFDQNKQQREDYFPIKTVFEKPCLKTKYYAGFPENCSRRCFKLGENIAAKAGLSGRLEFHTGNFRHLFRRYTDW
jgi:hypothetical protein